ncbi:MAG: sensor histidine kinase [Acidobacteriota bacterium]|jgi:nitrogen fixation/metabolism regulation signal transduction histidine kinase|nr:HAMP domain-containing protein [Bryobacteraceae bacterium CoA2 C42]MCA2964793.1 HAMP domain-containing protein [Acidobacteriaceae bacterium]
MRKRLLLFAAIATLIVLLALVVWQGSFNMGKFGPSSTDQVLLFWAMSTFVFLLMVTMAFLLFRILIKLYIERSKEREGSGIKAKLVMGAMILSFLPVIFMVLWSYQVLNLNIKQWFSRPAEGVRLELIELGSSIKNQFLLRLTAQAHWLASLPETAAYAGGGERPARVFDGFCEQNDIAEAYILTADLQRRTLCAYDSRGRAENSKPAVLRIPLAAGGTLVLAALLPIDLDTTERDISRYVADYDQLSINRKETRQLYLTYLALITLFILFVAAWVALYLARQITEPIIALLTAAREVRGGNLKHRVQVGAIDELATLVRAFNDMTQALETSSRELEARRRFTETILESIPTGVISVAPDGRLQTVNSALQQMFPTLRLSPTLRLEHLFGPEDAAELRYLMNRARRTGVASRQLDLTRPDRTLHLSVTVAPIDQRLNSGFVLVLEDTSELLRAQKAAAWHEVARRVAHEIKNPLTPIALSAERIARQLEKTPTTQEFARVIRESTRTIAHEVETVKTLVDEFSQFARLPAAQPQPSDLNQVIETALAVFAGRLDHIELSRQLAPGLPPVNLDREQFKRVIVNLVDNAAEAMEGAPLRRLLITTAAPTPETVELTIADTGCGISPEDKEKLFLPYFSTKNRGTGLGLAIVNHILGDHQAQIRVEDNDPAGARFIIEIPALVPEEAASRA